MHDKLSDAGIAASKLYEESNAGGKKKGDESKASENSSIGGIPASFNRSFVSNGVLRKSSSLKLLMCA
jgi:hypothetical protein